MIDELGAKLIQAKYGADFQGDQTSYGSNLYLSTGSIPLMNQTCSYRFWKAI